MGNRLYGLTTTQNSPEYVWNKKKVKNKIIDKPKIKY